MTTRRFGMPIRTLTPHRHSHSVVNMSVTDHARQPYFRTCDTHTTHTRHTCAHAHTGEQAAASPGETKKVTFSVKVSFLEVFRETLGDLLHRGKARPKLSIRGYARAHARSHTHQHTHPPTHTRTNTHMCTCVHRSVADQNIFVEGLSVYV